MITADLRERTKLKYAADCKCGQCQCVPVILILTAASRIERLERENDNLKDHIRGVSMQLSAMAGPGDGK